MLKAYSVTDMTSYAFSTVVFAETAGKARALAMHTDACEDAEFTDILARRRPELDDAYRGNVEMDWDDSEDRIRLVRDAGFECSEEFDDEYCGCDYCPAKEFCGRYERMNS